MYNLDYLKSLEYRVIVEKDSYESDSWYIAYAEELGKNACYGEGQSPEEAVKNFFIEKEIFIEMLFDLGKKVSEPDQRVDYCGCNGNISVRTTPQTHALLLREAKRANTSLNLYINNLLLTRMQEDIVGTVKEKISILETKLDKHHRYAETKKVSYDRRSKSFIETLDPFADATEYWLEQKNF